MKKFMAFLMLAVMLMLCACSENKQTAQPTQESTPTPEPIVIVKPEEADILTSRWVATELSFSSDTDYGAAKEYDVVLDVVFTNRSTGTCIKRPAFYDGDGIWRVRFAPTETGIWDYKSECATDEKLNGKTGTVGASTYSGDLDIYKHGFVTVKEGNKYFTYADGTPFFYLGDTHWTMLSEEFDTPGDHATTTGATSHFKYIVDKRVEQGFTVYQSEPIGSKFSLSDRITNSDLKGFKEADKYFQYIAEKGLVHANASFFFPTYLSDKLAANDEYLQKISRYWVARFGAYPVMWTLGQEVDNGGYDKHDKGDDYAKNNPWVKIAEYVHSADAYNNPLTAHQLGTEIVTVTGAGTKMINEDLSLNTRRILNGRSSFDYAEKELNNNRTGHNWWASQWKMKLNGRIDVAVPKDYWQSSKPAINYEGRYCNFQTLDTGARLQGYISFLSGMYGYGYGCADMWAYKNDWLQSNVASDGLTSINANDKAIHWGDAINLPSAKQMTYMKSFFTSLEWWKLVPDFYDYKAFEGNGLTYYVCASDSNNTYVVYFYGGSKQSGVVKGMDTSKTYTAKWFNPVSGNYTVISDSVQPSAEGTYLAPQIPNSNVDWVLLVTKN
jgi:hypothetical protein